MSRRQTTELTEQSLFDALDWLRDNAEALGLARGHRVWMEERRKIVKAELMNQAGAEGIKSVAAQEVYAYAHPDYKQACEDMGDAHTHEVKLFAVKEAAQARIAAFQTISANKRIEQKAIP